MSAEIITRRRLPHWYVSGAMHFVTYRLHGTIPINVLRELKAQKNQLLRARQPTREHREYVNKKSFALYDDYLDQNCKIDWLANPAVAAMIRGNLYHHDNSKYHLLAYCIMPNHVHVLFQPIEAMESPILIESDWSDDDSSPLTDIMHSLKSYTAKEANKLLRRTGAFWQKESYDHWVRDDDELERIIEYIANNPVKAKLVKNPHDWYFSSAHDRYLTDGCTAGWLLRIFP